MNPAPRSNRFTQPPLHAVREMLAVDSSAPGWSQRPWGVDGDSIKGLGWGEGPIDTTKKDTSPTKPLEDQQLEHTKKQP